MKNIAFTKEYKYAYQTFVAMKEILHGEVSSQISKQRFVPIIVEQTPKKYQSTR